MIIRPGPLAAAVVVLLLAGGAGCTRSGGAPAARAVASPSPSSAAPCNDRPGTGFPPLLTGFDERLATPPSMPGGTADPQDLVVTVLIQGACIAVVDVLDSHW